jgi:hypothetical protein
VGPSATQPTVRVFADHREWGRCKACNAPLVWVYTYPRGKSMPLERASVALSTFHDPVEGKVIEVHDVADCHFVTCPQADRFRAKRTR